jgi:putative peptidoglycan lipid II flippase
VTSLLRAGVTLGAARGRWRRWTRASDSRKILGATIVIGGLAVAIRLVSLVRDVGIAAVLGTSDDLDAYLTALLLPSVVVNVIAGSLDAALIPAYIEARDRDGAEAAQRLLSEVMFVSLALLGAMTALLALLVPYLLPVFASGFTPGKLTLARRLSYVLLPSGVLSGVATLWSAVLNAGERFALAALAPVMVPLLSVIALLVGRSRGAIYALSLGFIGGMILQAGLLAWGLVRVGVSPVPRWCGGGPALRQVIGQYLPMIVGMLLMHGTILVDQAMAAGLSPGSVSTLNYGNKVVSLILNMVSMALGTAVLPYFSQRVAAGDWAGLRATLWSQAVLIVAVTLPLTAFIVVYSEPIVRLLFQRGTFTAADTRAVGGVQALYALQIPVYTLSILLVRMISALRMNDRILYGTIISFVLNILLDVALVKWIGLAGVALSTSIVYLISFIYISLCYSSVLRGRGGPCG